MALLPLPSIQQIDAARNTLTSKRPGGTQLTEIGITTQSVNKILWQAQYAVIPAANFPQPQIENCQAAKVKFQNNCPRNAAVHQCTIYQTPERTTWTVTYGVNITGAANPESLKRMIKTLTHKVIELTAIVNKQPKEKPAPTMKQTPAIKIQKTLRAISQMIPCATNPETINKLVTKQNQILHEWTEDYPTTDTDDNNVQTTPLAQTIKTILQPDTPHMELAKTIRAHKEQRKKNLVNKTTWYTPWKAHHTAKSTQNTHTTIIDTRQGLQAITVQKDRPDDMTPRIHPEITNVQLPVPLTPQTIQQTVTPPTQLPALPPRQPTITPTPHALCSQCHTRNELGRSLLQNHPFVNWCALCADRFRNQTHTCRGCNITMTYDSMNKTYLHRFTLCDDCTQQVDRHYGIT